MSWSSFIARSERLNGFYYIFHCLFFAVIVVFSQIDFFLIEVGRSMPRRDLPHVGSPCGFWLSLWIVRCVFPKVLFVIVSFQILDQLLWGPLKAGHSWWVVLIWVFFNKATSFRLYIYLPVHLLPCLLGQRSSVHHVTGVQLYQRRLHPQGHLQQYGSDPLKSKQWRSRNETPFEAKWVNE